MYVAFRIYVYFFDKSFNFRIVFSADLYDALVILSNTIFFKGQWTIPFEKKSTKVEPFFDSEGKEIGKVNMMTQRAPFSNKFFKELDSDVVEIPYGDVSCLKYFQNKCRCVF